MKEFIFDKRLWLRRIFLVMLDAILINVASFSALYIRFDFKLNEIPLQYLETVYSYSVIYTIVSILCFVSFRLYHSLWKYAGIDELVNILFACGVSAILQLIGMRYIFHLHVPRSYYPLNMIMLIVLISLSRFLYRYARVLSRKQPMVKKISRTMLIGAGEAGSTIIKEIVASKYISSKVVCVIDDNKSKVGGYIHGVKVVGDRTKITEMVDKYEITDIVIAIPSASRIEIKHLLEICKQTKCKLKILPGIYQLINEEVSVTRLRDVEIEDLLGREQVCVDNTLVRSYIEDKIILVTGGGGSIGSELCRQIIKHKPKQLIIIDIYENNAYYIQQELKTKYPSIDIVVLIASVRNTKRMEWIFKTYGPNVVYHAAAHKHVPLMEESPNEAVKNNVGGTLKVVQACDKFKVERFILISSDKAVNPMNIMGATKRICEIIIQMYNQHSKTEFVAVRFGNVLGSNGSVIPLFKEQILRGGPVTVTHPDIIRYFMTITEAVSLVLQAGAYAKGGEIFVLDMGEPVRITDLAENLIKLSGYEPYKDIDIKFTGLRPGEKLYEELLMDEEGLTRTENKLIHIAKPVEFDKTILDKICKLNLEASLEKEEIKQYVKKIVPNYNYDGESKFKI